MRLILAILLLPWACLGQSTLSGNLVLGFGPAAAGVGGGSTNLMTNLIAYYKMEESVTQTRVDQVNALNLTDGASNLGSDPNGINGTCAYANGSSCQLTHADDPLFQVGGNQDFTFQVWINVVGASLGTQCLINKGSFDLTHDEYIVYLSSSAPKFSVGNGTTSQSATWGSTISDSSWHQIIAWYDHIAQTVNISVDNGTPVSQSWTGGTQTTTGKQFVAFDNSDIGGFHYTRKMDEVGFWKRVLTSSERTALWNGGAGLAFSNFPSTP